MDEVEINKTIAEFMGYKSPESWEWSSHASLDHDSQASIIIGHDPLWTLDLNMLIPVLDKLNYSVIKLDFRFKRAFIPYTSFLSDEEETVQFAAAYVTALAIKDFNKRRKNSITNEGTK